MLMLGNLCTKMEFILGDAKREDRALEGIISTMKAAGFSTNHNLGRLAKMANPEC